jgi:steroid 5-alpha reductase family enzyme
MTKAERIALISFPIILAIGFGLAWAGSQNGQGWQGLPLFAVSVGLAFIIQWVVFIPAFIQQTEKFFDITGSITYISITSFALLNVTDPQPRSFLLWAVVLIWAIRLGAFLYRRVHKAGKDDRFDDIKPSFIRFLNVWTIQGLWVAFTAATAWAGITSQHQTGLDSWAWVGLVIWLVGFAIETIADQQKSAFNANPANKGKFIQSGLWARSRHPNYFGEILLWFGVAIIAFPTLSGWQWVTLISPLFVTLLLTRVSGIPLLEAKSDKKWGGQANYESYKQKTPVLFPRIF